VRKPRKTLTPPKSALPTRWREALSDERMAHLIKDAFRRTSRCLQTRLAAHGLSYSHWTMLRILWQGDGLTQRQLSDQAGVTEPSTFAALQAMEKLGYISRQKMPDNNKQIRVFLTPTGAALRSLAVSAAEEVNNIALRGVSQEDAAATRRTLLAMIENLEIGASSRRSVAEDRDGEVISSAL
jgi:DNA-binding MarR family transcriptional regulator